MTDTTISSLWAALEQGEDVLPILADVYEQAGETCMAEGLRRAAPVRIQSRPVHPQEREPLLASDPPKGCAFVTRAAETHYLSPVGAPWPALEVGQAIVVEDRQGWLWRGTVESVRNADSIIFRVAGPREALPMPPVEDGRIVLPNISGHAHSRLWAKGDIVQLHGAYYRVTGVPGRSRGPVSSTRVYTLGPATEEQYATRPGRVKMSGEREARAAVGSCVQTPRGEWLHVSKVEYQTHRDSDGDAFGRTWYALGKHVPADKAERVNELHWSHLARALNALPGERTHEPIPADAAQLVPRDPASRPATGERVALDGDDILHERVGDPDMVDSWYHYVVRIKADRALRARVKKFATKAKK